VPFIEIKVENAPHDYLKNPLAFEDHKFKASIKNWSSNRQYPSGIVHGSVGLAGTIPVETEALLIENGITWSDFSDDVIECLPALVCCNSIKLEKAYFLSFLSFF
jgi:DIS3-like exonuclease 2